MTTMGHCSNSRLAGGSTAGKLSRNRCSAKPSPSNHCAATHHQKPRYTRPVMPNNVIKPADMRSMATDTQRTVGKSNVMDDLVKRCCILAWRARWALSHRLWIVATKRVYAVAVLATPRCKTPSCVPTRACRWAFFYSKKCRSVFSVARASSCKNSKAADSSSCMRVAPC